MLELLLWHFAEERLTKSNFAAAVAGIGRVPHHADEVDCDDSWANFRFHSRMSTYCTDYWIAAVKTELQVQDHD